MRPRSSASDVHGRIARTAFCGGFTVGATHSFASFGLAPQVLSGLTDTGDTASTPIQSTAIPLAMTGHDLIASASTGAGKTAACLLQVLHQLVGTPPGTVRVLTPTRELARQGDEQALAPGYHAGFSSVAVIGGVKFGA